MGDFAPAVSPATFDGHYLAVPWRPGGFAHDSDALVEQGLAAAMLIPTNEVDLSGKTCDKIGASYSAFRHAWVYALYVAHWAWK